MAYKHDPASVDLIVALCDQGATAAQVGKDFAGSVSRFLGLSLAGGEGGGIVHHTPSHPDGTPKRGDGGKAAGGLQFRVDVHGGDPEDWEGLDGLRRSLERAIPGRSFPKWRIAQVETVRELGPFGGTAAQQAAWFSRFWHLAQGCNPEAAKQNAAMALRAGREALAEYEARHGAAPVKEPRVTGRIPKPPIVQARPAHPDHYRPRDPGVLIEALFRHITDGGQPEGWFAMSVAERRQSFINAGMSPDLAGVGATHFSIDRDTDATIRQHAPLSVACYAHGDVGEPGTGKLFRDNKRAGADPNDWGIGIEFAGRRGQLPTEQQLAKGAWLYAWLWQEEVEPNAHVTGAVLDADHIPPHSSVAPNSRAMCPGWPDELVTRFLGMIQAVRDRYAGAPIPAPLPEPEPEPVAPSEPTVEEQLRAKVIEARDALTVVRDDYVRRAAVLTDQAATLAAQADDATATAAHLTGLILGL